MLTENEKIKIKLEETYRVEVQKSFSKGKKSKIMTFLNSSFGLFILSPVLLGLITFTYKAYEKNTEKNNLKSELSIELYHRLKTIETINDTLEVYEFSDLMIAYYGEEITKDPQIKQKYYSFRSFNNKYKNWSTPKLIDELYIIEKKENKKLLGELRKNFDSNYISFKNFGKYHFYRRGDGFITMFKYNEKTSKHYYFFKEELFILDFDNKNKKFFSIINGNKMFYAYPFNLPNSSIYKIRKLLIIC